MENVLDARRAGLLVDPLLGRGLEFRAIHRQLGRLFRRLEGRVPDLQEPRVIDRSGNLIHVDEKIRTRGDIGIVRHLPSPSFTLEMVHSPILPQVVEDFAMTSTNRKNAGNNEY